MVKPVGMQEMTEMQRLWAPWRMQYVADPDAQECIFCAKPKQDNDEQTHILYRREAVFVMLNAYPYANGHLMVAPYRHVGEIGDLTPEELAGLGREAQACVALLAQTVNPHGFNLGMNLGRVAGAGFVGHTHLHIVPRWEGDTNFMPVLADTRVLAEALSDTYAKLKAALRPDR